MLINFGFIFFFLFRFFFLLVCLAPGLGCVQGTVGGYGAVALGFHVFFCFVLVVWVWVRVWFDSMFVITSMTFP